nr:hypothetical protein Iba_chr10aCG14420 [Ipomoea batatas]
MPKAVSGHTGHQSATRVNNPIYPNNFCISTLSPSSPANFLRSTAISPYVVADKRPKQSPIKERMTYKEGVNSVSSVAQVFPKVVMTTPAKLTNTATTFAIFKESCPRSTPKKRVNNPEVADNTVVLATLV